MKYCYPCIWRHAASLDNHEYIFFQYVKYHTNNVITIVFIVVIRVKLKVLYLVLQQQRMHGYLHIYLQNTRVVESVTWGPTPEWTYSIQYILWFFHKIWQDASFTIPIEHILQHNDISFPYHFTASKIKAKTRQNGIIKWLLS